MLYYFQEGKCLTTLLVKFCSTITYCFKRCCRWIPQKYCAILMGASECSDSPQIKYTHFAWAGGTFFQLCCCVVSVFGSGGKQVLVYILMYLEYNTVVVLCQFFGCGRKQFLVLCTYLVYDTCLSCQNTNTTNHTLI